MANYKNNSSKNFSLYEKTTKTVFKIMSMDTISEMKTTDTIFGKTKKKNKTKRKKRSRINYLTQKDFFLFVFFPVVLFFSFLGFFLLKSFSIRFKRH